MSVNVIITNHPQSDNKRNKLWAHFVDIYSSFFSESSLPPNLECNIVQIYFRSSLEFYWPIMENSTRKLGTDKSLVLVGWRPQFDEPSCTIQSYRRGFQACTEASNAVQNLRHLRGRTNKI